MKVLIINYNRITLGVNMADWLAKRGCEPIFIDNHSDYPPLLDYYKHCPYQVAIMDKNYGHLVAWEQGVLDELGIEGNYIVTDPDLDLEGIPDDFLSVLEEGLRRYPQFDKCGFSLDRSDQPNKYTEKYSSKIWVKAADWDKFFWRKPLDDLYFDAPLETTFALYKTRYFSVKSLRTNQPYTVLHVPWYYDWIKDLPEDEQYYFQTQNMATASHTELRGRTRIIEYDELHKNQGESMER